MPNRMQPCMETRQKQFSIWVQYVLQYCKENGVQTIMLDSFPLFENRKIESTYNGCLKQTGSLDMTMRLSIMDQLCQQGYSHREKEGVYLMIEKSVKDWAYTIYNWVCLSQECDVDARERISHGSAGHGGDSDGGSLLSRLCSCNGCLMSSLLQYQREHF